MLCSDKCESLLAFLRNPGSRRVFPPCFLTGQRGLVKYEYSSCLENRPTFFEEAKQRVELSLLYDITDCNLHLLLNHLIICGFYVYYLLIMK